MVTLPLHRRTETAPSAAVAGVTALTPDGWAEDVVVVLDGDRIVAVEASVPAGATEVRADGLLALPGIVDLHGDGFERCFQPRPGVQLPPDGVVHDTERELLAAGITTFFWSVTDSYEPGLRSRATLRSLLGAVPWRCPDRPVDHRLHVRHEWLATGEPTELLDLVAAGRVDLLSINDHSPGAAPEAHLARVGDGIRRRTGLDLDGAVALLASLESRRPEGDAQVEELVATATAAGVPLASHDDATDDDLTRSIGWGVRIVEFPGALELAARARAAGAAVLMGAPNVARGGSHVGFPAVADAAAAGLVDVLCSDYHYPSLFRAPFLLAQAGVLDLAAAWSLVAERPAAAVGLHDRGRLVPGAAADVLLVDPAGDGVDALRAVWRAGRVVAVYR